MIHLIAALAVAGLVVIDQLTKYLATLYLQPQGTIPLWDGVFELTYHTNQGAAFGMFQGKRLIFLVSTILIAAVLIYVYAKLPKGKKVYSLAKTSIIVILAGAIGNFIDRMLAGEVVDFLYFSLIDFPIFNVADMYVVCGTIFFAILVLFFMPDDIFDNFIKKKKTNDSELEVELEVEAKVDDSK